MHTRTSTDVWAALAKQGVVVVLLDNSLLEDYLASENPIRGHIQSKTQSAFHI